MLLPWFGLQQKAGGGAYGMAQRLLEFREFIRVKEDPSHGFRIARVIPKISARGRRRVTFIRRRAAGKGGRYDQARPRRGDVRTVGEVRRSHRARVVAGDRRGQRQGWLTGKEG